MADMQNQIQAAYDMVDRRQNDAALKLIDEILAGLEPPNRVEIPAARPTIFDHLQTARRALAGDNGAGLFAFIRAMVGRPSPAA